MCERVGDVVQFFFIICYIFKMKKFIRVFLNVV